MALRLARDGAAIVACAARDRIERVAAEIEAAGGRALPLVADVTSEIDMHPVARAVERFGRLDVSCVTPGSLVYGAIDDITPDQMHKLMDNTTSAPTTPRGGAAGVRRQGHGRDDRVTIVGKRGVPFMGAYSATKFSRSVSRVPAGRAQRLEIHVSAVFPFRPTR